MAHHVISYSAAPFGKNKKICVEAALETTYFYHELSQLMIKISAHRPNHLTHGSISNLLCTHRHIPLHLFLLSLPHRCPSHLYLLLFIRVDSVVSRLSSLGLNPCNFHVSAICTSADPFGELNFLELGKGK